MIGYKKLTEKNLLRLGDKIIKLKILYCYKMFNMLI